MMGNNGDFPLHSPHKSTEFYFFSPIACLADKAKLSWFGFWVQLFPVLFWWFVCQAFVVTSCFCCVTTLFWLIISFTCPSFISSLLCVLKSLSLPLSFVSLSVSAPLSCVLVSIRLVFPALSQFVWSFQFMYFILCFRLTFWLLIFFCWAYQLLFLKLAFVPYPVVFCVSPLGPFFDNPDKGGI